MAKGWMAEIVSKCDCPDGTRARQMLECRMSFEVLTELPRDCFGDLRHFE
jgi:hypothetical protein